jgi:hypothetical protein
LACSLLLTPSKPCSPRRRGGRVSTRGGALLAVLLTSGGGCLYTDPINMAPHVHIVLLRPAMILRGDVATFGADLSDPDGDTVALQWTHTTGAPPSPPDCPTDPAVYLQPANWPDPLTWPRSSSQTYEVSPPDSGACVWAFARDQNGAVTAAAPYPVQPGNHAPVPVIDIVEPDPAPPKFSRYSRVKLSARRSSDTDLVDIDRLSYTWSLSKQPQGPALRELSDCSDETDPRFKCLWPDPSFLPGNYEIQLVVGDGKDSRSITTTLVVEEDQLPCLAMTTPEIGTPTVVRNPTESVQFTVVHVLDDGDPFPVAVGAPPSVGAAHFSWFLGTGTEPLEFLGRDSFVYTVPADRFSVGADARVRVEITDRNQESIRRILDACGDEALCAARTGCLLRMTWKIQYR